VLGPVNDELINNWANIAANKVFVSVEIRDVSDELTQFIYDERDHPGGLHHGMQVDHQDYERLKKEYYELGEIVLREAFTILNRLISYARNYKDQYWLNEYAIDFDNLNSLNNLFDAKVSMQGRDSVRWCPPARNVIQAILMDEKISIHREDWGKLQEFVGVDIKPDFILELLSNADLFVAEERRRSAIVEAISALELAVVRFSQAPKLDGLRTHDESIRIDIERLRIQVEHLGFSGTVKYLLPLLFPPEILATDILKKSQEAIEIRNTVIHNGRRDIDENIIRPLISSVRRTCEILLTYTNRR
jgi:hypothetical protein